ncbi:MAG: glucose-1-phosphate thymidylyltransferase [Haloarculaceae archaeon]
MKGIILGGGRGTRLRPLTHTGPKQLIPVANRPVIEYAVEDLREAGITEIAVVLGNKGREEIQAHIDDGSAFGVAITYVVQGDPLGIAHAVGCCREFVGDDDCVVYLGDNVLRDGITELVGSFEAGDHVAGIALQHVENPGRFGVADVDGAGRVRALVEKPEDPPSDLALVGVYVFSSEVFDAIDAIEPSWRDELEITDAIQWLLEHRGTIDSHVVEGWWKDTGRPEDIIDANRLLLEDVEGELAGTVEDGAEVSGRVDLRDGARVEDGAVVRGPASIASGTVVEAGTYVGPYTSIGPDTRLAGAHVENSVVVGESTITTEARFVDSLVGRGATVGSADGRLPAGNRLVTGENSQLEL